MKNMISIFIILITSIMLSGCSEVNNVSVNEDYALAKKIAKEDLSEEQKKTITPWRNESVVRVDTLPGYLKTDNINSDSRIYRVQFYTNEDDLLGPIGIYVDVTSQKVIGYVHRN